ncbi:IclR family transcriptional regulator [uncultured Ruegeria sp.]|uniref:IclR family transcriptional regulator n=1 Tax=uncultured Ruegeria sp. TaxID=259304 RepID=UPI0026209484|nr:IclR family transcriptional regulator [uncultured Ruegeria sp.]
MDKAVVKAFRLLEILARSNTPMGVTALSEDAGLGKSNVHRLLQTMAELGYVDAKGGGDYSASLRIWELGSFVFARLSIREVARPMMEDLARISRETVHLSELHHGEVLYIDKIESSEPVRAYTQLGGRAPAYCTATGKAMLAFAGADERAACLTDAQAFTSKTINAPERFEDEADRIRIQKYAINRGEWRSDVLGLAAPIVDGTGKVIAAIGISGPASRLDPQELETMAPRVVAHAESLSRAMGCSEHSWATLGTALPTSRREPNDEHPSI